MLTKESFIEVLEGLRLHTCAYSSFDRQAPMCDCKFHREGDRLNIPKMSEDGNGCPELLWVIRLINSLTEKQLANFLDHGTLKAKKPMRVPKALRALMPY